MVIIGDGIERKNLEKISEKHSDRIIFTGRLEGADLLKWDNVADCFILASYQEPFGAVTNEALLAGCKGLRQFGIRNLVQTVWNGVLGCNFGVDELEVSFESFLSVVFIPQHIYRTNTTDAVYRNKNANKHYE